MFRLDKVLKKSKAKEERDFVLGKMSKMERLVEGDCMLASTVRGEVKIDVGFRAFPCWSSPRVVSESSELFHREKSEIEHHSNVVNESSIVEVVGFNSVENKDVLWLKIKVCDNSGNVSVGYVTADYIKSIDLENVDDFSFETLEKMSLRKCEECSKGLEYEYYHLHQGLCAECEANAIEKWSKE